MDGNAILQAFATCSGPDCLRDVVKKFGYRVKVYNFIKSAISNQIEPPSSSRCSTPITPISRSMVSIVHVLAMWLEHMHYCLIVLHVFRERTLTTTLCL